MKRAILPYEEEIVDRLNEADSSTKYSYWMHKSLNEEHLKKKFGEGWDDFPSEIKEYYRAQGYQSAAYSMKDMILGKKQMVSCNICEIISQEIIKELETIIRNEVCRSWKEIQHK